jgi:dynein heavy chain
MYLKDVLPKINEAIDRLQSIKKQDIDQIKGYNKPPEVALVIMEAASILLTGKSGDWVAHRVMLQRMDDFIRSLIDFPRDNIPEDRLRRVRTIIAKPILE